MEGYFDVIGAEAAGIDWAVASMGTALTEQQARLMARYADEVIVGYDGDEAGERAYRRALAVLLAAGLTVRRARFESGHDPDSLRLESGPEALRDLVEDAPDAVSLEVARLIPPDAHQDPGRRARAARAAQELLKPIRGRDSPLRLCAAGGNSPRDSARDVLERCRRKRGTRALRGHKMAPKVPEWCVRSRSEPCN